MVHFESDVIRSYLRDTMRVLEPGGRGFFHHSNYTGGEDWRTNPSSRNFMSQAFFSRIMLGSKGSQCCASGCSIGMDMPN